MHSFHSSFFFFGSFISIFIVCVSGCFGWFCHRFCMTHLKFSRKKEHIYAHSHNYNGWTLEFRIVITWIRTMRSFILIEQLFLSFFGNVHCMVNRELDGITWLFVIVKNFFSFSLSLALSLSNSFRNSVWTINTKNYATHWYHIAISSNNKRSIFQPNMNYGKATHKKITETREPP